MINFPQCIGCKHYHGIVADETGEKDMRCDAFHSVPQAIVENRVDHRKPYQGDNGIQWESSDPDKYPWLGDAIEEAYG